MRTPNQGLALGLSCDPWDSQVGPSSTQRKSSFPGNTVTDSEAGKHRADSFRVNVQQVYSTMNPQRDATYSSSMLGNSL